MFQSCEEVLLRDALSKFIERKLAEESFVKCILEIIEGLSHCHDENDQVFWRKKISYILLNNVVNEEIVNNINKDCRINISWGSFFNIISKCGLWSSLFSLLFSLATPELLNLVATKWKTNKPADDNVCDSIVFCMAMLSSFVTSSTTAKDACMFEALETKIFDILGEFFSILKATKLSKMSLDQEKNLLLSIRLLHECLENASELSVDALHLCDVHQMLTSNLYVNAPELKKVVMLDDLSCKQTVQDTNKSIQYKDFLKNIAKTLKDIVSSLGDQSNPMVTYLTDISTHLTALVNLRGCQSCIAATNSMDEAITGSLHCVKHFLPGYEESTGILLNLIKNHELDEVDIEKCLRSLQQSRECLLRSHHIKDLFQVLSLFISNYTSSVMTRSKLHQWISTVKELVVFAFQNMPSESKPSLLEFALQQSSLNTQCIDFLGGDCLGIDVANNVKRQINLVFNKIISNKDNNEQTVDSICNVAILSPSLTVSKMTEQIIYHEEHHELFALSLCKLDVLAFLTDKHKNSFFLRDLCKYLSDNQSDSVLRNVQKFLCMLLYDCLDDWKKTLARELFCNYILPSTKSNNTITLNEVSLINGVELFASTFVNKEAIAVLDFDNIFLLAYAWAMILESDSTPDEILALIKSNLPYVVEQTEKLVQIIPSDESESLLKWAENLVVSLNWCTQLYFRPIFQHVEGHKTVLPACLKTVCDIAETDVEFQDCYGEGSGLTAWLQCMVVEPGLIPTSSLKLQFNSVDDQDMFCNGMVVALCQLLPNSTEDEWTTIMEALIALVVDQKLFMQLHSMEALSMPWINLSQCFVPLSIIELLHKVTVFMISPCCKKWMNVQCWCRYAKNYSVNAKNLFSRWTEKEGFSRQSHLFMLFCFFCHACGLICLLELNETLNLSKPIDSCFVLALDLMNEFCKMFSIAVTENEKSESSDLLLLRQCIGHKNQMINVVEGVNNKQIKETLLQKLSNLS